MNKLFTQYFVLHRLHRGFEIGMAIGDKATAFLNGLHFIQKAFIGGANLSRLKEDTIHQLKLIARQHDLRSKAYFAVFKETLSELIDKTAKSHILVDGFATDELLKNEGFENTFQCHLVVRSFWV